MSEMKTYAENQMTFFKALFLLKETVYGLYHSYSGNKNIYLPYPAPGYLLPHRLSYP